MLYLIYSLILHKNEILNPKHKLRRALEQYVKPIQYVNLKKTTEKHLKFKAYAKQQSSVET